MLGEGASVCLFVEASSMELGHIDATLLNLIGDDVERILSCHYVVIAGLENPLDEAGELIGGLHEQLLLGGGVLTEECLL